MNQYCVVYRTGGTENFKWHRSVAMSKEKATETAELVRKGGRKALVENFNLSVSAGLPETYDYA